MSDLTQNTTDCKKQIFLFQASKLEEPSTTDSSIFEA